MSWLASKTKQPPDEKTPAIRNFRRSGAKDSGKHRLPALPACSSRQLAETSFEFGSLREIVADKLPATAG
jgi:hypothetical protein